MPLAPLLPIRSANNVPRPSPIGAGEADTRSEAQSPERKSIKQIINGAKNRTPQGCNNHICKSSFRTRSAAFRAELDAESISAESGFPLPDQVEDKFRGNDTPQKSKMPTPLSYARSSWRLLPSDTCHSGIFRTLFVPQGDNRIDPRSAHGRVQPENYADSHANKKRKQNA